MLTTRPPPPPPPLTAGSYPLWGIVPGAIRDSTIDEISDGNGGTIETQPTMNFGGGFAITACIVLGFTGTPRAWLCLPIPPVFASGAGFAEALVRRASRGQSG